jgi:hypothetical protein
LHKLQFTFEKVLKTIVKSFEKIVKSFDNSYALAHPIVKSYDKIVNKTVIDCIVVLSIVGFIIGSIIIFGIVRKRKTKKGIN